MPVLEILCDNDEIKSFYQHRTNYDEDSGIDLYTPHDVTFEPGETKLVNLKIPSIFLESLIFSKISFSI